MVMRFEILSPGNHLPVDYWTSMASGATRTEIEIGPGDGRFLIEAGRRRPDTVWVGLETRVGLARHIGERADRPLNVRIHQCDARWIIEHLIADESVDAFHAYFPDPWWKKRHHKRRLFTPSFAAALRRTLRPGGSVYLLTDVEVIFREAALRMVEEGLNENAWSRAAEDPAQSSYERKYRRQGRRLFEGRYEKQA
jgi:tRNA (guanine-N7-)-methyltransferase